MCKNWLCAVLVMFCTLGSAMAENMIFPPDCIVDLKSAYGLKGDGVTDDTAALQKAIDELKGKGRILYFANGTYLLSDSVGIFNGTAHSSDRFLTYQGQSEAGAIIKLKDKADGFDDPKKPKLMFSYYDGKSTGDVMHSYVRNMTFDVGSSNPGAVGLRYLSNNVGAIYHVTIRSSDPKGAGAIGLDLRQSQQGPAIVQNVTIIGFDTAIEVGNSFSMVIEHIMMKNQGKVGFFNQIGRSTIRDLKSENTVPAVRSGKNAQLTLIEADLTGGDKANAAIEVVDSGYYLRDIKTTGYGKALADPRIKEGKAAATLTEVCGNKPIGLLAGDKLASLRLPIKDTPEVPWPTDLNDWVAVQKDESGDDTAALQKAFDTAAAAGKSTVYLPKVKGWKFSGPVRMHGSVNRLFGSRLVVDVTDPTGEIAKSAFITFENLKSDTVVVEQFFLLGGWKGPKVPMFRNLSGKTIVLRDMGVAGTTKATSDRADEWFIQNVSPSRTSTLAVGPKEKIWARQFNPETPKVNMIEVDGGQLWVLGLKTEGRTTHVLVKNGGKAEIIGGVAYQSWGNQELDPPLFISIDSDLSATLGMYSYKDPFKTFAESTANGKTEQLSNKLGSFVSLYRASSGKP